MFIVLQCVYWELNKNHFEVIFAIYVYTFCRKQKYPIVKLWPESFFEYNGFFFFCVCEHVFIVQIICGKIN